MSSFLYDFSQMLKGKSRVGGVLCFLEIIDWRGYLGLEFYVFLFVFEKAQIMCFVYFFIWYLEDKIWE